MWWEETRRWKEEEKEGGRGGGGRRLYIQDGRRRRREEEEEEEDKGGEGDEEEEEEGDKAGKNLPFSLFKFEVILIHGIRCLGGPNINNLQPNLFLISNSRFQNYSNVP